MPPDFSSPQAHPARRWAGVGLRGLHLVAVIVLGAGLLGAPVSSRVAAWGVALSGFLMFGLDVLGKPHHLRETSGVAVLVKLAVVAWMALDESRRALLFWVIVMGSAIFAHAPARFRHALLIGK